MFNNAPRTDANCARLCVPARREKGDETRYPGNDQTYILKNAKLEGGHRTHDRPCERDDHERPRIAVSCDDQYPYCEDRCRTRQSERRNCGEAMAECIAKNRIYHQCICDERPTRNRHRSSSLEWILPDSNDAAPND